MASVVATWIGAAVILGGATEVYEYGFQGIVWDPFAPALTLLLAGFFFVKRLRRTKYVTVGDYYISRYGKRMAMIFSIAQAVTGIAWLAAQFKSFGVLIHMTTGFDAQIATVIGAAVILFVSMSGGLWALSRTDMISFIIITICLIFMLPYTFNAVGGFSAFLEGAGNLEELPQWSLFYSSATDGAGDTFGFYWYGGILGVLYAISAWIAVGFGDLGCPVLNARTLAAKSEGHAKKGFIIGGIVYLFLGMIPILVGTAAFIISNGAMPAETMDYILPWFVQNHMPAWIGIMFMVSLAAAIVSTAGDTILIDSTVITSMLAKWRNPNVTDAQLMKKLKFALPIYAVIGYLVTFAGGIYELLVFAGAALFPTIAASYIFGLFWKKTNETGALASFWAGIVSWIVLTFIFFIPATTNYFDEGVSLFRDFSYIIGEGYLEDSIYIAAVPAFAISVITLIVVSLKTQKNDPPNAAVDCDGVSLNCREDEEVITKNA
jgi:Na+/proline symporter